MLTEVILQGEFAKVAGKERWLLDCNSPAEALSLISVNCGGKIRKWIRENLQNYQICQVECESENGVKESLNNDSYQMQRKAKTIRFLPIFTGAGGDNGIIQAIAGVAMIVIGAVVSVMSFDSASTIGGAMISAGVGMVLGAIATMLISPSKNDDDDDGGTSYYFNGAVNTTTQGNPVPLVFGRCRVGSAVISSSIDITEA